MRPLNDREKRTLRLGGIGVGIYLVLFLFVEIWRYGEHKRSEYDQLLHEALILKQKMGIYGDRAVAVRKLMEQFRMDPARLSKATVVAGASAAIQQAAMAGGIQLGPIRESKSRTSAEELTSMQLEGVGPVPAILRFLQSIGTLGYPLIGDSVQLSPDTARPGQLKMNVTMVILDFEQWKGKEVRPDA